MVVSSESVLGEEGECSPDELGASSVVKPGVHDSIGTVIDAAGVSAREELSVSLGGMPGVSGPGPVEMRGPGKLPTSDIPCSLSANGSKVNSHVARLAPTDSKSLMSLS